MFTYVSRTQRKRKRISKICDAMFFGENDGALFPKPNVPCSSHGGTARLSSSRMEILQPLIPAFPRGSGLFQLLRDRSFCRDKGNWAFLPSRGFVGDEPAESLAGIMMKNGEPTGFRSDGEAKPKTASG
jgi:hypothetical protein